MGNGLLSNSNQASNTNPGHARTQRTGKFGTSLKLSDHTRIEHSSAPCVFLETYAQDAASVADTLQADVKGLASRNIWPWQTHGKFIAWQTLNSQGMATACGSSFETWPKSNPWQHGGSPPPSRQAHIAKETPQNIFDLSGVASAGELTAGRLAHLAQRCASVGILRERSPWQVHGTSAACLVW